MIKRNLFIFLVVLLLIPCLVVPASAVSTYGPSGVYDTYEEGIFDYISYYFGGWEFTFDAILDAIGDMEDAFRTWWSDWDYFILELYSKIEDEIDRVVEKLSSVDDYLHSIRDDIDTLAVDIGALTIFTEIRDKISGMNHNIRDTIVDQTAYIGGYLSALSDQISGYITAQKEAIVTAIDNLAQILNIGADKGNEFQDDVVDKDKEAEDMIDVLESMPAADPGQIDSAIGNALTSISSNVESSYYAFFNPIFTSALFPVLFLIPLIYAMVGYILYGKRW